MFLKYDLFGKYFLNYNNDKIEVETIIKNNHRRGSVKMP